MTDIAEGGLDLEHPKYPHLENLDRVPFVLLREDVKMYVSEKLHGTNARFGKSDTGELWVGSRNQVITSGHHGFYDWAAAKLEERKDYIPLGTTFVGEWVGKGIQKGIDYGAEKRFFLFAVLIDGELDDPANLGLWADRVLVDIAPQIYEGIPLNVDALDEMRKAKSWVAEEAREGIVIVIWPLPVDQYGHRVIAKYKNPAFEERAKAPRPDRPPVDIANVQAFVDQYATDNRLTHVLDQVHEFLAYNVGTPDDDPLDRRNMGVLLKTFYQDVVREGQADYELLSADDQKLVGKVLNVAVKRLLEARRQESLRESSFIADLPEPLPLA